MSMPLWLARTGGGNFIKEIICSNLTLSPYQTIASSSFPCLLSNSSHGTNATTFAFRYSYPCSSTYAMFSGASKYSTTKASEHMLSKEDDDDDEYTLEENQAMNFPGGKITYTTEMNFLPGSSEKRVQCYRVLDEDGCSISSNIHQINKEVALKVYSSMVTLNTMDKYFYESQRQGRLSFYLTSFGEEAINLGSAAAIRSDDIVLAQYREPGILLWRGFTVQDFANQCFGNNVGHGKGRQMPLHYGSKNLNFVTISAPLADYGNESWETENIVGQSEQDGRSDYKIQLRLSIS